MADRPPTYAEVREREGRALHARPRWPLWVILGLLVLGALLALMARGMR